MCSVQIATEKRQTTGCGVNVSVVETRQYSSPRRLYVFGLRNCKREDLLIAADGGDNPVRDGQRCGAAALRRPQLSTRDEQVWSAHATRTLAIAKRFHKP